MNDACFYYCVGVQSGEVVALKKVPLRKIEDGIPNQALREIKALQEIGGDSEEAQNVRYILIAKRVMLLYNVLHQSKTYGVISVFPNNFIKIHFL